jgi:hypothetical protein
MTTVYNVSDALLAEYGLRRGHAIGRSYPCDDSSAVLLPVGHVRCPVIGPSGRGLQVERLRPLLAAIATGMPLPPVPVYREPGRAVLLGGVHRFAVSLACGYPEIPCRAVTLAEAQESYRYPEGQC